MGSDLTPVTPRWPDELIEQAVRRHAEERPDEIAVVGPSASYTWAELDAAADRAAAIIGDYGPGARVAWFGANDVGYPVVLLGCLRARAGLIGLNWRLPDADLAGSCVEVGVTHVFTSEAFALRVAQVVGDDVQVEMVDQTTSTPWPDVEPVTTMEPEPDDLGLVFFTSGSTGVPKAVPLSRLAVEVGASTPVAHGFTPESRLLIIPPVFHLAGSYWCQYGLLYGARQVYIAVPSPEGIVRVMSGERITHAVLVPTLIRALLDQLRVTPTDLSHFRHLAYGAAAITQTLLREAIDVLRCEMVQVFGMTEAGGVVTFLAPEDHVLEGPNSVRLASAGRCTVGVELAVKDPITGEDVPTGEPGELWFRTPFMASEYINRPQQTAAVFIDGWVNSRDMGRVDADGYVYVDGRSDDMIVTGGENVHPAEVENVISQLPQVMEVAVFGIPDEFWGRRVAAAVVVRDDGLDEAAIVAHCRELLAGYKIPKTIRFLDELPKTATGKIVRESLQPAPGSEGDS